MHDQVFAKDVGAFPLYQDTVSTTRWSHLVWLSAVDHCGFARARRSLFPDQSVADVDAGRKSAFKLNSVGAQFRTQLKGLMAILTECQPHYVRCAGADLLPFTSAACVGVQIRNSGCVKPIACTILRRQQ